MDPINPLNSLAELLWKRIASEAAEKQAKRTSVQRQRSQQTGDGRGTDVAALRVQIADAVRTIDPDDPSRNSKAMHVFVENVLAWQFGSGILNDPAFADLAANVQSALEKDSVVSELLQSIIADGKGQQK